MKTNTQTTTKKQSHFSLKRIEGEMTNEWMMEKLELSVLEYNTIKYNLGLEFLNEIHPEDSLIYKKHFLDISTTATFWKWWRSEWDLELQDYVNYLIEHKALLLPSIFIEEMRQLVHYSSTEQSFYQYLKLFK